MHYTKFGGTDVTGSRPCGGRAAYVGINFGGTELHQSKERVAAADTKLSVEAVAAVEAPDHPHPIPEHEPPRAAKMLQ